MTVMRKIVRNTKNVFSRQVSYTLSRILQKTGLIAVPIDQGLNLESTIKSYVKTELVQTVFDIGSFDGSWTINIGKKYFPNSRFFLFEANSAHFPYTSDLVDDSFNVLLSNEVGIRTFYSINGTGDSIYKEKSRFYQNVKPQEIPTNTIDNLILQNNLPVPSFVKIDVQGAELDVIRGMKNIIFQVRYLLVELNLLDYNLGAPSACEVIAHLEELNFVPRAIPEIHVIEGILSQIDVFFENVAIGKA